MGYFHKTDMIQNRAITILAITGDMGWVVSTNRRWANVLRLWNRLANMNEKRLKKKVFNHDYSMTEGKYWCSEVKTILTKVDLLTHFHNKTPVDLIFVENHLLNDYKTD